MRRNIGGTWAHSQKRPVSEGLCVFGEGGGEYVLDTGLVRKKPWGMDPEPQARRARSERPGKWMTEEFGLRSVVNGRPKVCNLL